MSVMRRRFLWTFGVLLGLVVVGTVGYVAIEQRPWGDAFYMTVITVTAVGYEEVWPLSPSGRAFTMTVLIAGITWMGLWFATITSFIVEMDLEGVFRRRRAMREIGSMRDHVIICGAGRTGRQVAEELSAAGHPFLIIEHDPHRIESLREYVPHAHCTLARSAPG